MSELEQKHRRRLEEINSSGNYNYKNQSRNHYNQNKNQWNTFHSNYHSHAFFVDSEEYGGDGQDNYYQRNYDDHKKYSNNQFYTKSFKGKY